MILAADIGGTKSVFGYLTHAHARLALTDAWTAPTRRYPSCVALLEAFLAVHRRPIRAACLALAAPIIDGERSYPANLPWVVERASVRRTLQQDHVWLINDLEATAYGLETLRDAECVTLQAGRPQPGSTRAVLAAGTSLGETIVLRLNDRTVALASEGGHADFAPRTAREWALREWLQTRYGHVSIARVVSGPGLVTLYQFLHDIAHPNTPAPIDGAQPDAAERICAQAGDGHTPLATETLDWFVSLYGAAAGDLALRALPVGGLFLGGGIAPQLLPQLRAGGFLRAFLEKGRLRDLLTEIPVHVIMNPQTALHGAGVHAWRLSRQAPTPSAPAPPMPSR